MKRSNFTEQQIAFAMKQAELGTPVEEICRKMGISNADVFCLEEEVRGLQSIRTEAGEAANWWKRTLSSSGW